MKIVFIGTVELSLKALKKLIELEANIVGVCTKKSSTFNSDFADLSPICEENNINCKYIDNINDTESTQWIKSLNPDIIFCFWYSFLIKKDILNLAPIIGYHPAKLPQNRGRHPIIWALALGLKKSASTFFFMDEGADSGDILSQVDFDISHKDNAMSLYDKVTTIALSQIEEFLPKLENKSYKRIPQNHKKANVWRKRNKLDGIIDFKMSSEAIYNLVRALSKPYIGAHIEYKDSDIIVWECEIMPFTLNNIESGKVLESNEHYFIVKTYDSAIKITNHEFVKPPKLAEYL